MTGSLPQGLPDRHRQMLKAGSPSEVKKVESDEFRREIGQAFDWALDQARINKGAAASTMGYSDQTILSRWIAGTERVQLDKCRLLGDDFFWEFICALGSLVSGVKTIKQLQRIA